MNLSEVSTAFKVADILPRNDTDNKNIIKMYWYEEKNGYSNPLKVLKDNSGRVYLIGVDGVIKKIGGSQSIGGIKNTWSAYCGGMGGSPSVRTYGIPILIREKLDNGSKVELYMITSDKVEAPVKGLFGEEVKNVSIDFKAIENKCKEDFKDKVGHYPEWNFQESGKPWPRKIQESCNKLNEETSSKSKRNR
mgnify:CR=1 FL=1|tara:strand:- start:257 stop:832 length:576 start_codon:yes stop_codon:yes gene_type:complete